MTRVPSSGQDRKELKRLRQRVAELEVYEELFRKLPIGASILTLGASNEPGDLRWVDRNQQAEVESKIDSSLLMHKTVAEAFPAGSEGPIPEAWHKAIICGEVQLLIDVPFPDEAHPVQWFRIHAVPLGEKHVASIYVDVTEEKKAREARLESLNALRHADAELKHHARELERSNQELERFAYTASHDLQEPLRMISSYAELLRRRYQGQLDSDADDFIEFVVDGAVRMQRLIDALLSYSRVGTRAKPFEPTDCTQVLETVKKDLELRIEESGAVVTHDPLPMIRADATQLGQLIQNLIANAIKFRGKEPPRIHVSVESMEDCWVFSVRDNGIGIETRDQERIFSIFQRLHGADEYTGSGVGLATCKKIVTRHNGDIWVESQPGVGSTFYFTISKKLKTREEAVANE